MSALQTAAAYKILKGESKEKSMDKTKPTNLKEAVIQRPLVWLTIAAVVGYVGYRIVRGAVRSVSSQTPEAKKEAKEFEKEGMKPTYFDSQYQTFAGQIYSAGMNCLGTCEDDIYAVMNSMRNDLDVAKLIQAFGQRRLEFSTIKGDLGTFLKSELTKSEMDKVNSILASNGIKYKF